MDMTSKQISPHIFFLVIISAVIISLALLQRLLPISGFNADPAYFTVDGEPVLANVDGYYYLHAAKEIINGTYDTVETHRAIPDTISRSSLPPLLSLVLAKTSTVTGYSLNEIGVILPAILSLFLAIPVFLLGYKWGGSITAISAVIFTLFSSLYVTRTNYAFLDTDCLNSFFAWIAVFFALQFATCKGSKKYIFFITALLNTALYLWWWDQSLAPPLILGLAPLFLAILFYYRPSKSERRLVIPIIFLFICIFFLLGGWGIVAKVFHATIDILVYVSDTKDNTYPRISEWISEQQRIEVGKFAQGIFYYKYLLIPACAGTLLLLWRQRLRLIICIPVFCVGILALLFATRFTIFAVPAAALSLGYFFSEVASWVSRHLSQKIYTKMTYALLALLTIFIAWQEFARTDKAWAIFPSQTIHGMKRLQVVTEPNAVIWSWWDQGHPLVYWANRDTINDGMVHSAARTYNNVLPLTMENNREAANFISFYVVRGLQGVENFNQSAAQFGLQGQQTMLRILRTGSEQWKDFYSQLSNETKEEWQTLLFPQQQRPVYLFNDIAQQKTISSFYWVSTWDSKKGQGKKILPLYKFPFPKKAAENFIKGKLPSQESFHVDPQTLVLTSKTLLEKGFPLYKVTLTTEEASTQQGSLASYPGTVSPKFTPDGTKTHQIYTDSGKYDLDINIPMQMLYLIDDKLTKTLIYRLFWRKNNYDPRYFKPVELKEPYYQIWKVTSDMAPENLPKPAAEEKMPSKAVQ
jgi:dolichyl-diphosphooligosaccharide--protein glycosyltransferase